MTGRSLKTSSAIADIFVDPESVGLSWSVQAGEMVLKMFSDKLIHRML